MFKKKYQKYINKIGGFVDSSCRQIDDEQINKKFYNYVFNNEMECNNFYNEIDKFGLNKYTMNKEEILVNLTLENLMMLANYPDYWKLYLKNKTEYYEFYRLIHFACIKLTSPKYVDFWNKMAIYPDLWEIKLPDSSDKSNAGKTPLHIAANILTTPEYYDFWNKMAEYSNLWKIQMTYSGKTPLHLATENLKLPKYKIFWEKMTKYPDLWEIQLLNTSGLGNAGLTPLHSATTNLNSSEYFEFWEKMAKREYIYLWKIQMKDSSGEGYAGKTPLHTAASNLTSPKYFEFWNKFADKEYIDLWKIQMTDASGEEYVGQTPLHIAAFYLISPEYLPFFEKIAKYINIDRNDKNNIKLAFNIKSSIFEKLFRGFNNKKTYDVDYYISAHGELKGSFFKLNTNITVIFIAKSYARTYFSKNNQYISAIKNDLNTTLNLCDKLNILRIYENDDLVPNLNFQFFDISQPFKLRGILNKENYDKTLREYFELTIDINYNNPLFYDKRDIIDDLGIFESKKDKKNIESNLHDIIKYISNKHKDKNITLVVGSYLSSNNYDSYYSELCKYIQLIDRTNMPITKYNKLCYDKTKIISKNKDKIGREMTFDLERQHTFATPEIKEKEEKDIFHNFDKDVEYALELSDNADIQETQRKLISYEQISFTDMINVYKHIIDNQEKYHCQ
jgi:hypothetical protein